MKKIIVYTILAFLGFAFTSCQNKTESQNTTTTTDSIIKVDSINFDFETPTSISKNKDTTQATVHIVYPKLSGGNRAALSKINQFIEAEVRRGLYAISILEDPATVNVKGDLATITKNFVQQYEENNKETEYATSWYYESIGDTTYISPKIISLYYNETTYAGGAHGSYNTYYYNFDASTGDLLKLEDFISDTTAFKKLVEKKFYESEQQRSKTEGYDFDKTSYFFEGPFAIPSNISIRKNGLSFIYNPYEAAAYAMGAMTFDISWKELEGVVRKERVF